MKSLREHVLLQEKGVVSLVGSGGKTTLMFRLAAELAGAGERVLTTSTTKILEPTERQSASLVVGGDVHDVIRRAEECLAHHPHVTAARENLVVEGKLVGFDPSAVQRIWETGLFRWVLVEADGAAGRPLKAPAEHEPVVPGCSTLVVGLVGLDAVGQPLGERYVFRPEIYSRISGLPLGSPVTEPSIASVIEHEEGLFKGSPLEAKRFVFLNKAEDGRTRKAAEKIGSLLLKKQTVDRVLMGALREEPPTISTIDV
jgi:probable selenium-dependent hydroxylase accessory protein YqeC